jgi:hypothetical protein
LFELLGKAEMNGLPAEDALAQRTKGSCFAQQGSWNGILPPAGAGAEARQSFQFRLLVCKHNQLCSDFNQEVD